MTWFAFQNDGSIYELNGLAEKQMVGTFAHGYSTMAQAWAHKNAPANVGQAALLAGFEQSVSSLTGGKSVGVLQIVTVDSSGKKTGTIGATNNPVVNPVKNAATAVVNDMLKPLFNKNLWIRVGEVIAGLILLGIGVNALFKGKPMGTVTKVAGKVAPLAMVA